MRFIPYLRYQSSAWILFCQKIKALHCPHCPASYTVKCHGSLYGVGILKPETVRRGLRFYCSNRYSNQGCGRTFSIHFNTMLPYLTSRTRHLSAFLRNLLGTDSIHRAWFESGVPFSLRCAYRWVKQLKLNLPNARHKIHSLLSNRIYRESNVTLETISILQEVFKEPDFCSQAQQEMQIPLLRPCRPSS